MLATTLQIDELGIPANLDVPDASDFMDMVAVRNAVEATVLGSDALACTAADLLPVYLELEFEPKRIFVARVEGRIVGRAILSWSIADGTTANWIIAEVAAEFRCRGIGSALYRTVENLAVASGRPTLQVEALHTSSSGGPRVPSTTGFGDLPANDPGARFLVHRGYRLEQIERVSFLRLPIDRAAAEAALQDARAIAGADYSLGALDGPDPRGPGSGHRRPALADEHRRTLRRPRHGRGALG